MDHPDEKLLALYQRAYHDPTLIRQRGRAAFRRRHLTGAEYEATLKSDPGRFNALGTLVGLYALVVGVTGLELLGVQSWVEQIFDGTALIIAVAFARAVSADSP